MQDIFSQKKRYIIVQVYVMFFGIARRKSALRSSYVADLQKRVRIVVRDFFYVMEWLIVLCYSPGILIVLYAYWLINGNGYNNCMLEGYQGMIRTKMIMYPPE
ncbi:hypothetical protein ACJX0J_028604, partial [Zea mays]